MNQSAVDDVIRQYYELYTPLPIVEAARKVMCGIDLDPASSEAANKRIRALRIFTVADDGLSEPWAGRLFMNHPFSRRGNPLWIGKLVDSYLEAMVTEACCITYAETSEAWFQPLMKYPQCFLSPRMNYLRPDGSIKRGTKGSAVTYLGPRLHEFVSAFRAFGQVKVAA